MALLVLFSTFSFAIEQHYCGDELVDFAVMGHVETCGMELLQKDTATECGQIVDDCCTDEVLAIDGQKELKISFENLNLEQQQFVAAFVYTYIKLYALEAVEETPFKYYTPRPWLAQCSFLGW